MIDAEQVRFICGVIGVVLYLGICAYPMSMYIRVVKQKSVGKLKPDCLVLNLLPCALWFIYGLPMVHEDGIFISTISGLGFLINFIYLTVFFVYCEGEKFKNDSRKVAIFVVLEIIVVTAVVLITNLACETAASKHKFLGLTCLVFGNFMLGGHVDVFIRESVETKSVKHRPFWLPFLGFLCFVILIAYSSVYQIDLYFLIFNGIGAFLTYCEVVLGLIVRMPIRIQLWLARCSGFPI